jgi:hypothetical protein
MMVRAASLIAALASCGDKDFHNHPVDAPRDMSSIDAPPVPTGPHYHYVFDSIAMPTNNTQALDYGLDLDGDEVVNNQLGMVLGTFAGMGFDVQASTDQVIDQGTVIDLVDVQTADFSASPAAGFMTLIGDNPSPAACNGPSDTVCRHHLDGTGSFALSPLPSNNPLLGTIVGGTYTGGPGHLTLQLPLFGAPSLVATLIGARVKAETITPTALTAIVAGAITVSDVDTQVIPALQVVYETDVMRDCSALASPPACGCVDGSEGKTLIALFDLSPHDCQISVDEIHNNSLFQALLAPDLVIEGKTAISVGVKVTAVHATFTVPGQ